MDPVDLRGALLGERLAVAGEVAQLADGLGWDEARLEQTPRQEQRQPGGVDGVGLAPRHVLDVAGVDQHHLEVGLQDVVDGLPIHPGGLHGHVGHSQRAQPVREGEQVGRRRAEGGDLFGASAPLVGEAGTNHQLGLADVDPGATLDQLVELFDLGSLLAWHGHLPGGSGYRLQGGPLRSTSLIFALDGSSTRCRSDLRAKPTYGLQAPRGNRRRSRRPYQHFMVRDDRPQGGHGELT